MRSIHYKLLVNFAIFFSIGVIGTYAINVIDTKRKDYSLESQSKLIESEYKANFNNFKMMTTEFSHMYQNNIKLMNFLFQANNASESEGLILRKKVYNLLLKDYKRLEKIGVSQVHFYLKNGKSFLRMYKPFVFDKDFLHLQNNVIQANTGNPLQEGFKLSRFTSGSTFSYPLFDEYNQYIAGVEITYSTKYLIENIMDDYTYDAHLLLPKDLVKSVVDKKELAFMYKPSWELLEYYIETQSHKQAKIVNVYHILKTQEIQDKILKNIQKKQLFSMHIVHHDANIIMTFLALEDISQVGSDIYLVTYTQSDYLSELVRENKYLLILFFSLLVLMFLFTSYVFKSKDEFEKLALFDNLTKLPNRVLMQIEFEGEIKRAIRYDTKIALLFVDLDGFKAVNDTYGHKIGDELLLYASKVFSSLIRNSDVVARIGGDEFVIILKQIKDEDKALLVASNIVEKISEPVEIKKRKIHIGASIGISIYPDHAEDIESLLKIADNMMYKSKNAGKNRVTLYTF